jgi:hypothetical protein
MRCYRKPDSVSIDDAANNFGATGGFMQGKNLAAGDYILTMSGTQVVNLMIIGIKRVDTNFILAKVEFGSGTNSMTLSDFHSSVYSSGLVYNVVQVPNNQLFVQGKKLFGINTMSLS